MQGPTPGTSRGDALDARLHSLEVGDRRGTLGIADGRDDVAAADDRSDLGVERVGRPLDRRERGGGLAVGRGDVSHELGELLG